MFLKKLSKLRGIVYFSSIFFASITGSIFLMGTIMPLTLFPCTIKLHRKLTDAVLGAWFLLCTSFLELLMNMKFRITGDTLIRGETSVYIMNHRTRLDWMWFWPMLYHYSGLRKLKIVLKSSLKWWPGFGWAMQQCGFIFLNRNIDEDKETMESLLNYYKLLDYPVELLMYPEGTDFYPQAIESSNKFARNNNLPEYKYCLHPRKTGFQVLLSNLLKQNQIEFIQDVTIGYPKGCIANEKTMIFQGEFPEEVHFHVEKYAVSEVPQDWEGLGNWVENRFEAKEARLRDFYEKEEKSRVFAKLENVERFEERRVGMYLSLLFWPAASYLWVKLCMMNTAFYYYQISILVFYAVQPWWFGGFDLVMAGVSKLVVKAGKSKEN